MPMKGATIVAVVAATTAAAIALAVPAQAKTVYQFLSPDGEIACTMSQDANVVRLDTSSVSCWIRANQPPCNATAARLTAV